MNTNKGQFVVIVLTLSVILKSLSTIYQAVVGVEPLNSVTAWDH